MFEILVNFLTFPDQNNSRKIPNFLGLQDRYTP